MNSERSALPLDRATDRFCLGDSGLLVREECIDCILGVMLGCGRCVLSVIVDGANVANDEIPVLAIEHEKMRVYWWRRTRA